MQADIQPHERCSLCKFASQEGLGIFPKKSIRLASLMRFLDFGEHGIYWIALNCNRRSHFQDLARRQLSGYVVWLHLALVKSLVRRYFQLRIFCRSFPEQHWRTPELSLKLFSQRLLPVPLYWFAPQTPPPLPHTLPGHPLIAEARETL